MKTVNLELSKELKEAGYPQEARFRWYSGIDHLKDEHIYLSESAFDNLYQPKAIAASPTADEILERLPSFFLAEFDGIEYNHQIVIEKEDSSYLVGAKNLTDGCYMENVVDESLADALAQMWLYLKKEGLL